MCIKKKMHAKPGEVSSEYLKLVQKATEEWNIKLPQSVLGN